MANITKEKPGSIRVVNRERRPVIGGAIKGGLAAAILSGANRGKYMKAGALTSSATTLGRAVGRFTETLSTDGDVEIQFFSERTLFLLNNDTGTAVVVGDREGPCYVLDDQTVTGAAGNHIAGIVYDVTSEGVWVDIDGAATLQFTSTGMGVVASGTSTLVSGTKSITGVTGLTGTSKILVSVRDPGAGAITGFATLVVPVATRNTGAGSFVVTAVDDSKATITTAVCTFDWAVLA